MSLIRYAGGILKAYGGLAGTLDCCCGDDYAYKECKCCQGYDGDEYICGSQPGIDLCNKEYTVDITQSDGTPCTQHDHHGRVIRGPKVAEFGAYYEVYLQYYEMDLNKCDPTITGTVTIFNHQACQEGAGDCAACRICDADFEAVGLSPVYTDGVCEKLETNYNTDEYQHCLGGIYSLIDNCGCYWEVRISECKSGDELTEPVPKFIGIVGGCTGSYVNIGGRTCTCANGSYGDEPPAGGGSSEPMWSGIGFYIIDPNFSIRDCCKTCPTYDGDDGYV